MQLQSDLWIEGPYHVDFSPNGELRIVGGGNHLYLGLTSPLRDEMTIEGVTRRGEKLTIRGKFHAKEVTLLDPVVRSVRVVRSLTERSQRDRSYAELIRDHHARVAPDQVRFEMVKGRPTITYRRLFGENWYGARLIFTKPVSVKRASDELAFIVSGKSEVQFQIVAESSFTASPRRRRVIRRRDVIDLGLFRDRADFVRHLLDRTALEITHLVRHDKTSGFEYGTVFPRDWMESADLGAGDLSPHAVDYMYEKALQFVSPEGMGWHENLIGEAAFEAERIRGALLDSVRELPRIPRSLDVLVQQKGELITRHMIDIEPRYLMGMASLSPRFWRNPEAVEKLRHVGEFVLGEARSKPLITFREKPPLLRRHRDDRYYGSGNWRDSEEAWDGARPPIAPFDVNAVFYPAALRALKKYGSRLGIEATDLPDLLTKWGEVEKRYRFRNADGKSAYALALSEVTLQTGEPVANRLEVNHTDEAYLLSYGNPDRQAIRSFAERLLDEAYFYTPSGPTVVGRLEEAYSTRGYHGIVIWTKQTAFCSWGIARSLQRARRERWARADRELLERALRSLCMTSLNAFATLGGIPELHYDHEGTPRFYDDQPEAEGQMSKVQLWSAVGARRILRDYYQLVGQV